MTDLSGLIAVFEDAETALRRPGNDFLWSGWEDQAEALTELAAILAELRGGSLPDRSRLQSLFAPTGPIQEVSISSGWSEEFLALASRFDTMCSRTMRKWGRHPPR